MGWELTLACNLKCLHCGSSASLQRKDELNLEESLSIVDQFPELFVQEVTFTGGEPLLNENIYPIAERLRELKISSKVITNGLHLLPDVVAHLKDVGIVSIGVSIDGLHSTHDYIRGKKGLFDTVLSGLSNVIDAEIPVTVVTTVNALNLPELPALSEVMASKGVSNWQVQPIFPLGRVSESSHLQLTEEMYLELGRYVENYPAGKSDPKINLGDSFGYYADFYEREPSWQGCPAGIVSCGIMSDGKVKGCLSLPDEFVEGDLRKDDLWDIWFHPDSFSYNRRYSADELGAYCESCGKAEDCKGGCSAMSYGSTGQLHNDPYCFKRLLERKT